MSVASVKSNTCCAALGVESVHLVPKIFLRQAPGAGLANSPLRPADLWLTSERAGPSQGVDAAGCSRGSGRTCVRLDTMPARSPILPLRASPRVERDEKFRSGDLNAVAALRTRQVCVLVSGWSLMLRADRRTQGRRTVARLGGESGDWAERELAEAVEAHEVSVSVGGSDVGGAGVEDNDHEDAVDLDDTPGGEAADFLGHQDGPVRVPGLAGRSAL